ncbi:putative ATPase, AAA-type, core, P-loop containing nucleoside triphosphate hydrolase [Helianthus annuus]|nr:putative ATPase, AAA-type, core, P-loop containing nucleoside triphosphate hydrolase [Helianthus annuus]
MYLAHEGRLVISPIIFKMCVIFSFHLHNQNPYPLSFLFSLMPPSLSLRKWPAATLVAEPRRQLRLQFQVAEKSQPSIILFDEIDGLAPSRTRQQDQTHNSVVSTLFALLDCLKSRGSVIVIGATNRPDAINPALRRPGRFDREIYFSLPSVNDREAILSLHMQKWPTPVNRSLLKRSQEKPSDLSVLTCRWAPEGGPKEVGSQVGAGG